MKNTTQSMKVLNLFCGDFFDLSKYKPNTIRKDQILRNKVDPEIGEYIFGQYLAHVQSQDQPAEKKRKRKRKR